jgi:small GTP-binding protein
MIVLGKGEVGKTSIINTYFGEEFPETYMPTIGSLTFKKEYSLSTSSIIIRLTVWDLGGQKSFNPYNPAHYSNADLAILVFDLTKPESTLENLKKEFDEKINKSTDECISIFAGNKIDLFDENIDIKNLLQNYFNDRDHFILMSAKTSKNVNESIELLLYTYLQRAEILTPELVPENTAEEFLKSIEKDEQSLKSNLITLKSIDKALESLKSAPKLKTKDSSNDEVSELKYGEFIQQEIDKVRHQKDNIIDQFLINLSELDKALIHIKKSHIKSAEEIIDTLKNLLTSSKNDIEQNIVFIEKLNREENELMIINSQLKKENEENHKDSIQENNVYNL